MTEGRVKVLSEPVRHYLKTSAQGLRIFIEQVTTDVRREHLITERADVVIFTTPRTTASDASLVVPHSIFSDPGNPTCRL